MRRSLLALVAAAALAPGCLVLSTHPAYDGGTIEWDPALLGSWIDAEDNTTMEIQRADWRSYRIGYAHPIETGELTGYLTTIGGARYLDVMPSRGTDRGAFLVPVHAVVRVDLDGDRLEVTPLSYDWFAARLRSRQPIGGLQASVDQRENALILSPTARLRTWLAALPRSSAAFGAPAVFTRRR